MATLNLRSGTAEEPAHIVGGTYDNLWGDNEHYCIVEGATIANPPPGMKPQIFGCSHIVFQDCTFRGIRASAEQSHVEGIHINGCQEILFERVLWEDNDVFHVFITQWGGYPAPSDIHFVQNRFGLMGPAGGYYSVKVRDEGGVPTPPCPGLAYVECARKGPHVWPSDVEGADTIVVVEAGEEWPAWDAVPEPPEPTPEPPSDPLEARVTALEATVGQHSNQLGELTRINQLYAEAFDIAATANDPRMR